MSFSTNFRRFQNFLIVVIFLLEWCIWVCEFYLCYLMRYLSFRINTGILVHSDTHMYRCYVSVYI